MLYMKVKRVNPKSSQHKTKFFFYFFIYLFLAALGLVAVCGLSLVAASKGYSSLQHAGFSLRWLLLLRRMASRRPGFSSCSTGAQQLWLASSRAPAQQLWRTGLAAPRDVGSSQTRARTHIPCIGRWILNHCATREALYFFNFVSILDDEWPLNLL